MNPEYNTASAAPDATPAPASRAFGTPLGTMHFLTVAAAKKAADTAMASALAKGYPVSVTVVDRDGIVIAQQRADTAAPPGQPRPQDPQRRSCAPRSSLR